MQVAPDNRLRELREARGLKLYDLASLVRRDPSMIARYESGESQIPLDVLRRLADHFGVSAEHLLGWDREEAA